MLEWVSTGNEIERLDDWEIEPWPWHHAQVQPGSDGTWSAWMWEDGREYPAVELGQYRSKLRAKVAVEAVLGKLESEEWVIEGADDFGGVTRIERSMTFDAVRIDRHVEALVV